MNCFRQGINFEKCGAKNFNKTKTKLDVGKMGLKPKQDPDNPCDLSEKVIRASDKSGY